MKMCLLIKVASGTNWNQGLMLAMTNVGQEVELSHNEEKQSVIFRPFFHFLSPCYLSSWLSGTSIYRCVCVCWEDDGTVGCRQGGSISTAHCPPSGTTGCYQPQPGSCSYNASLPVCARMHFHPANNASLHVSLRAPWTFLPVSLPSVSHVICSSHIYRADLCLLRKRCTQSCRVC